MFLDFNIFYYFESIMENESIHVLGHFSHVWLFVTPWTVAHHTPLSVGFSRLESWSGSSRRSFRIRDWTCSSMSPALAGGFLPLAPPAAWTWFVLLSLRYLEYKNTFFYFCFVQKVFLQFFIYKITYPTVVLCIFLVSIHSARHSLSTYY